MQTCLTPEQKELLMKYIRERRYSALLSTIIAVGATILGFPLMIADLQVLLGGSILGAEVGFAMPVMMLARYHRHRYYPGEFAILWCFVLVISIILFVRNYGLKFGKNCDLDCVRNDAYFLEEGFVAGKSEDKAKHPYFFYDDCGKAYACPVFLDWKHAERGSLVLYIMLRNGNGYALVPKTSAKEWWEEDPF